MAIANFSTAWPSTAELLDGIELELSGARALVESMTGGGMFAGVDLRDDLLSVVSIRLNRIKETLALMRNLAEG